MPSIPTILLDCVFYLYEDRQSAEAGENFGASGFLVSVDSVTHPNSGYVYAITNYHAAVANGCCVVRLNTKDGGTAIFEFDSLNWQFIPGNGDVAATAIPLDSATHRFNHLNMKMAVTQEQAASAYIDVGDNVFMVGRFIEHDGGQTNAPAVRFGNISLRPTYLEDVANSNEASVYYCLDMHSRTGFSGSPVFVYRTFGTDLNDAISFNGYLPNQPPVLKLLGIHCGQFLEEELGTYSGMTFALPAWKVAELLNSELFINARTEADAKEATR